MHKLVYHRLVPALLAALFASRIGLRAEWSGNLIWDVSIMPVAPLESAFPTVPATWYLFGQSREVRGKPVSRQILGRSLVAFRGTGERVVVMEGRCSHLSADLGRGRVVGDCVQCPFHHWEYDLTGRCTRIPSQTRIPEFARQRTYPCVERHGQIFFFAGDRPLFPLPFFEDCDPGSFRRGRPFRFHADFPWYLLVSNAFDEQHFQTVHDRRMVEPPVVDLPAPFVRRIRYRAEVTGDSVFDRLLRPSVGRFVEISITSYGGPLVLVTGKFARARSYIIIAAHPRENRQITVDVTVFAPRSKFWWLHGLDEWLGLEVRRLFTRGFMQDDIQRLPGIKYNRHTLVESDGQLIEYLNWAAGLPSETDHVASIGNSAEWLPEARTVCDASRETIST